MFRSPVSNGHNKTAGFSRLSLWRKRKSPRPQEAKGPSSVYYEAASNRHDGKSRIYGFETPYVSCSIRHFPPTTFYSMTLFIISARSSTKNRLKSLCKISFRRIFSISISLNKTTTTTTTVPRKSNSRRVHDLFRAKVPYPLSHSRSKLRRWDRAIARLDAATRRREFTSPLAFSPRIIRDQQYKSGTKSSRFEREESSFPSLRNPSSPRISHLHLSVSNARF